MIVLAIENPLFKVYLKNELNQNEVSYEIFETNQLFHNIESLKNSILFIQSDNDEELALSTTKRLKRLLGMDIKIVFFSSDYKIEDEARNSCDAFLPAPSPYESIMETVFRISSTLHKVLLIDDSKLVHSQLVPALRDEGYEVYEAFDGKEGYEKAIQFLPDLIICDIEMPVMNGFEACTAIRNDPKTQDIYIIMSSTLGSAADMQKGFESGVDEYITKPVVIPELMERIGRVFKQSLSGREDILVLEEDPVLSSTIIKSLKKQGFSTKTVRSLDQCMKQIRKSNYDMLLIDSELSEGNAMDFILNLKNFDNPRKPSILLVMSRENAADAKMAINMGVSSVLSKPFSMDNMLAIIERVLAVKRSNSEKEQLLRYMSKSSVRIAEEKAMISDGVGSGSARAINCDASVFFSDIVSFTNRCEKYSAGQVVEQINELFSVMSRVIQKYGGDIDKFMGDACMAFWMGSDPTDNNLKMVRAALEIKKELIYLNQSNRILSSDPISIRIGMNSGEVILCDLGSPESRIDLTIIGDNVNLASRLEAASKQYGVDNLISESIHSDIQSEYLTRPIDKVKVVGKERPSLIFEILRKWDDADDQDKGLVEEFTHGFQKYSEGDFSSALEAFEKTLGMEKDNGKTNPSNIYIARCRKLLGSPPENWEGVWTLTSK